ncbi:hypothetical protein IW261DRAFT_1418058 [Armillaria novae-zelandiae]|uniref:Uncharacterized protein n=1 Tax=Armillaria novae-zelandiae TaxID=153914 RepID=A0AA39UAU8_9AGAR|nr:hypothetical protein IW261DRAFT_1418058 [Armillaria novae-zelandiae]
MCSGKRLRHSHNRPANEKSVARDLSTADDTYGFVVRVLNGWRKPTWTFPTAFSEVGAISKRRRRRQQDRAMRFGAEVQTDHVRAAVRRRSLGINNGHVRSGSIQLTTDKCGFEKCANVRVANRIKTILLASMPERRRIARGPQTPSSYRVPATIQKVHKWTSETGSIECSLRRSMLNRHLDESDKKLEFRPTHYVRTENLFGLSHRFEASTVWVNGIFVGRGNDNGRRKRQTTPIGMKCEIEPKSQATRICTGLDTYRRLGDSAERNPSYNLILRMQFLSIKTGPLID